MILRVKDILDTREESIKISEILDDFTYNDFTFSPVNVKGKVWVDSDFIKLRLNGRYTYTGRCDRCLEPVKREKEYSFEESIDMKELTEVDDLIDIDNIVIENILLEMPNKVLCRSDCLGLCPDCGINLNKEKCNCKENRINPQFAALEKLLQGKGEN